MFLGSRSNYANYLGAPELRINVLKLFAENGGFERLRGEWCPPEIPWRGSAEYLVVMKALRDVSFIYFVVICSYVIDRI